MKRNNIDFLVEGLGKRDPACLARLISWAENRDRRIGDRVAGFHAGLERRADEREPGIADERRAGIADERHIFAIFECFNKPVERPFLVVFVERHKCRICPDMR